MSMTPRLVITAGDPCGVGPEVILKALTRPMPGRCRVLIIGDLPVFEATAARLRRRLPAWDVIAAPTRAVRLRHPVTFLHCGHRGPFRPQHPDARAGAAAVGYLDEALRQWRAGRLDALVTAPVTKWAIGLDRPSFQGHTEHLARATRSRDVVMMFISETLRVALLTRHVPLRRVSQAVTAPGLTRALRTIATTLRRDFGVARPRLALCGVNPHAGEAGRCGGEELRVMRPVLTRLRRQGLRCEGPVAADGLFACLPELPARFDVVVCPYHDQGLIPFKMVARDRGCQLTAGLPFVRTSPDHGSALDLAGQGRADPGSMRYALELALRLARRRGAC